MKAGAVQGAKVGFALSAVYATLWSIISSLASSESRLVSVLLVVLFVLFYAFFIAVIPSSIIGAITGGLTGWLLSRRRRISSSSGAAMLGAVICLAIISPFNIVFWPYLFDSSNEFLSDEIMIYLSLLGLPSLIYVLAGSVMTSRLYKQLERNKTQFEVALKT